MVYPITSATGRRGGSTWETVNAANAKVSTQYGAEI
jgi:hypothetical protein